jgi:molybdate transport system substrate-binding protein
VTQTAIRILAPAAFAPAFEALAATVQTCRIAFDYGPATGTVATSITSQLKAGTDADFVILPKGLAQGEHQEGRLGAPLTLALSSVAFCMPQRGVQPDISSKGGLIAFLADAPSIGLSPAGSGKFFREILVDRLALDLDLRAKLVEIADMPVGAAVRMQKVAIGFQQKAELLQEDGIAILADLPEIARNDTPLVLAKIPRSACSLSADDLLAYLRGTEATASLAAHGLDPVSQQP